LSLRGGPDDEMNCESLERVIIGDDPERFFQVRGSAAPTGEGGVG